MRNRYLKFSLAVLLFYIGTGCISQEEHTEATQQEEPVQEEEPAQQDDPVQEEEPAQQEAQDADSTLPTVTITSAESGSVVNPFPVTITFSEEVFGFGIDDISVTGGIDDIGVSSLISATVSNLETITANRVYSAMVDFVVPISFEPATITAKIAVDTVKDEAGNGNETSNIFSIVVPGTLLLELNGAEIITSFQCADRTPEEPCLAVTSWSKGEVWIGKNTEGTFEWSLIASDCIQARDIQGIDLFNTGIEGLLVSCHQGPIMYLQQDSEGGWDSPQILVPQSQTEFHKAAFAFDLEGDGEGGGGGTPMCVMARKQ